MKAPVVAAQPLVSRQPEQTTQYVKPVTRRLESTFINHQRGKSTIEESLLYCQLYCVLEGMASPDCRC